MTWKEMQSDPVRVKNAVSDRLREQFRTEQGHKDNETFLTESGVPFSIHVMGDKPPWDFLVIEYQDTGEDGDGFFPKDYASLDEMLEAMIEEITQ